MPKRINMPSYFRNIIKCLFKPSQPNSHLINNIFVIWCCLIRHTPSTIDKLYLSIFNQIFYLLSLLLVSSVPPSIQESNFHNTEFILWMGNQLRDNSINCILNTSPLDILTRTIEVLINSF